MNRSYQLVFSAAKKAMVVVSELGKRGSKGTSGGLRAPRLLRAYGSYLALSLSSLILIAASANNVWAQQQTQQAVNELQGENVKNVYLIDSQVNAKLGELELVEKGNLDELKDLAEEWKFELEGNFDLLKEKWKKKVRAVELKLKENGDKVREALEQLQKKGNGDKVRELKGLLKQLERARELLVGAGERGGEAVGGAAWAVGRDAKAYGQGSTALGYGTEALGADSLALGRMGKVYGTGAIVIGAATEAWGRGSLAVGVNAGAYGKGSGALGYNAKAVRDNAWAVGSWALAEAQEALALGVSAWAKEERALAVGFDAWAKGSNAIALGSSARAESENALAFGTRAEAIGEGSVALGALANAEREGSLAFGYNAQALGDDTLALGTDAKALEKNALALGNSAKSLAEGAIALGSDSWAVGENSLALGSDAMSYSERSVALGAGSVAGKAARKGEQPKLDVVAGYDPFGYEGKEKVEKPSNGENSALYNAWNSQYEVSIGKAEGKGSFTRRITNLAAGKNDTDAVNVAQLKALKDYVDAVNPFKFVNEKGQKVALVKSGDTWEFKVLSDAIQGNSSIIFTH